ncbi:MAG TPA: hypothetical protein VFN92_09960 [Solirubrobacterales bacterium]|nr:hypothetical protein [Solirubrobacterales bacterium]
MFISAGVRPDDFGIDSGARNIPQVVAVLKSTVHLWGVPADPAHNPERAAYSIPGLPFKTGGPPTPSEGQLKPFLRNPTSCEAPATFTAALDSYENPGVFDVVPLSAEADGTLFQFERCQDLPFEPTMSVSTTSAAADSPTGLAVDIDVPQNEAPNGRATSDVRKVVTVLPKGMAVSDSSAQGLGACSPSQIGIGSNDAPTCPDSAKIGSVRIDTPLLDEELDGAVYLAKQNDNPFGSMLAIYMAVKGPGFYLKLPGRVDADPATGQLTTTFDNTPQLPFEHLHLELKAGSRAPLVTPRQCGTYAVKSEIVPWSGTAPVSTESSFEVTGSCPSGQFSPALKAGSADPVAGKSSPFTLRVTRQDGEQNLAALDVTLPQGLLAKLKGVPLCGDVQAASGDCPAVSQVGRTTVGAGSGPTPVYVPEAGKAPTAVYLAGPYKGAPYSIVVKVPAQAGPFDLGTVAVRSGIYIDPTTTAVSVKSDPLPQILQGIPIAYRDVRVDVDRPDFMVNPTSCRAMRVTSTIAGAEGASASPSAPFAVASCDSLGFEPKLSLKFSGKTHRSAHPALKATLKMPAGGANIGKAVVLLPETEFIDNAHISNPCTRVQFDAGACPKSSILGTAKAFTPLLDQPLTGPVYFRSNGGARELPDLVADLNGQIHVTLVGFIDSVKTGKETARVRTRFLGVPDAPVSKFVLNMKGGDKGLIVNNTELCRAKPRAKVQLTGQNGKRSVTNPLVKLGCGKSSQKR